MPKKNSRSLLSQKRSQGKISTPDVLFANSIMKEKSYLNALLLLGVCSLALATLAIMTHYPGRIDLKVNAGSVSAQITLDGRPNNQSTLPPSK